MKRDFDALISIYRDREISDLPDSFARNVLREIRVRRHPQHPREAPWRDVAGEPARMGRRPFWLATGVAIALAIGTLAPAITSPAPGASSSGGLDFAIFSGKAKNLLPAA